MRQTDLPPALGPEISKIRRSFVSSMSNGTTFLLCLANEICSSGCTAAPQSIHCLFSNAGLMAPVCWANNALARMKSISAKNSYDCSTSGINGRNSSVNSINMRIISCRSSISSSLTRLLASTTASGSIKTVLPLADSSCTMPLTLRFIAGATGITKRPSRMVGETSFSITPSLCALRNILARIRDMLFSVPA